MLVTELDAKRLEILKGIMPSGRRFALLSSSATEAPAHQQAAAMRRNCSASSCRPWIYATLPTWRRPSLHCEPEAPRRSMSSPRVRTGAAASGSMCKPELHAVDHLPILF
jgi:hypothetical protein